MLTWQKIGGATAVLGAATFVFGFAMFATVLADYTTGDPSLAESVAFVADNRTALYIWNLVIYIVFGVALVPLALTLHERVRLARPVLTQVATAFGIIWAGLVIATGMIANIGLRTVSDLHEADPARAEAVWSTLDSIQNGLGGGNEITGGLWVLLISVAALLAKAVPKTLGYLGALAGVAGIVTIIPPLEVLGALFGLGLIVWFVWVGVVLLRDNEAPDRSPAGPL